MADVFIEHMITRRPSVRSRLIKAGILFAVIAVNLIVFVLSMIFGQAVSFLLPVVLIGSIWSGYKLARRQNAEFEYILTNGEMDVDRIFDRSTRKRLLSVDCRSFETLAPYKPAFWGEYQSVSAKIDASSGSEDAARYFAVFPGKDNRRTLLVFEPNDRMMAAFRGLIPRKIQS